MWLLLVASIAPLPEFIEPVYPTIYIAIDETEEKSRWAKKDFEQDFLNVNSRAFDTLPRLEQLRYNCKARRYNHVKKQIPSTVEFVGLVQGLVAYPQYRVGKGGKWHEFPPQAFASNAWFMLTVARISDEWTFDDRLKFWQKNNLSIKQESSIFWKQRVEKYVEERLSQEPDNKYFKRCRQYVNLGAWYDWDWYDELEDEDPCYSEILEEDDENRIHYYGYCPKEICKYVTKHMGDCPKYIEVKINGMPKRSYLPYTFDINKWEGFK